MPLTVCPQPFLVSCVCGGKYDHPILYLALSKHHLVEFQYEPHCFFQIPTAVWSPPAVPWTMETKTTPLPGEENVKKYTSETVQESTSRTVEKYAQQTVFVCHVFVDPFLSIHILIKFVPSEIALLYNSLYF